MTDAKFYNKMDFPIKFRRVWELNSPPVELQPGGIVEGPFDILSQFSFLGQVPFDFHLVSSETFSNGKFADIKITQQVEPIIITSPFAKNQPIKERHEPTPGAVTTYKEYEEPQITVATEDIKKQLPFNPETVNYITLKNADLEKAAEILNIDISYTSEMKPKDKKWELIRLVKKSLGIEIK